MMQNPKPWPSEAQAAERQAASYLPLRGSRTDLLPEPWPTDKGFPKPATALRSITAWFAQNGPQPMTAVPNCTDRWLSEIPKSHEIMHNGVDWLRQQGSALWPSLAVADLLAMWEAGQRGEPSPFSVPAVRDAVELWTIYQAIRAHVHAAIGKVAKEQGLLPSADPTTIDALVTAWRERIDPLTPKATYRVKKGEIPMITPESTDSESMIQARTYQALQGMVQDALDEHRATDPDFALPMTDATVVNLLADLLSEHLSVIVDRLIIPSLST